MRTHLFTFAITLFSLSCTNKSQHIERIGIQPFGQVPAIWLDSVRQALISAHEVQVHILPSVELPAVAFVNIKSPRYRADSLLRFLERTRPDTLDAMIGVTAKDISTTKRDVNGMVKEPASTYSDWGVFGLGYMPGTACVISSFRLDPGNGLFFSRLRKIAIHEIGHNRGLAHCDQARCVMQDAVESIATVDQAFPVLCEKCKRSMDR